VQRWSTRSDWFDWLIAAIAGLVGAATVWVGSAVVAGSYDLLMVSVAWAFAGILWSLAMILRATDTFARAAALALFLGALASATTFGPIMALSFVGPAAVILGVVVALGLLTVILVRQRPTRIMWLVAPAITVAAFAVDLSGIPQRLRFVVAEPALAAYVEEIRAGTAALPDDEEGEPVDIGSISIFEVVQESGQVRLVTSFVGILGDDAPGVGRSDHLTGPWYVWYPY
jgi:hypothetical protein